MNTLNTSREAILYYVGSNYIIKRSGDHVRCAVTGQPIPLHTLTYWSVEKQQAYASVEASLKSYLETHPLPTQ